MFTGKFTMGTVEYYSGRMEDTLADIVMKSVEDASNAVKGIEDPHFLIGSYTANIYLKSWRIIISCLQVQR